jgi:hypothetical protein
MKNRRARGNISELMAASFSGQRLRGGVSEMGKTSPLTDGCIFRNSLGIFYQGLTQNPLI